MTTLQGVGQILIESLDKVNPVRNSSRCDSKPSGALNPVRDLSLNGINPALRGGTPYGAEPGIILKSTPAAASGSESLWLGKPPAQPPAQKSLWLGERASRRGMSPSGAEPGPEGAAGHYF